MYGSLDISVSGMVAQRTRLETVATNIANADAILDENGEPNPFQRRIAHLAPAGDARRGELGGVRVAAIDLDDSEFRLDYDPGNPYADERGYVRYPNVDPTIEQVNGMLALRAYEANVAAAETTKTMMAQSLRLIA